LDVTAMASEHTEKLALDKVRIRAQVSRSGGASMSLQVVALIVGWVSALIGIWSKGFAKPLLPAVATAVTTIGLAVGITLTYRSAANSKRALESARQQMNATLAATELGKLRVEWTFKEVPPKVMDVFAIGDSIANANILADDEISRLASDWLAKMQQSWNIDSVMTPLIRAAADGSVDIASYFSGDVEQAIAVWSKGTPEEPDSEEAWLHTSYGGSQYSLLFPLNTDSSASLVLGKKQDDEVREIGSELGGQEKYFHEVTNYGFDAIADKVETGFTLSWTYELPSLKRATQRSVAESRIYAGMPEAFSFVIVDKDLSRADYLGLPARHFRDAVSSVTDGDKWFANSELQVFVNGQPRASYVYAVTRGEPTEEKLELSKYDDPEHQYTFTVFHCKLKAPS
jgi:hypothetical protein